MADNPTHTAVHPKLFLKVDGKLQKIEAGTPLVLTKKEADRLRDKVLKINTKKAIKPGKE